MYALKSGQREFDSVDERGAKHRTLSQRQPGEGAAAGHTNTLG